MGQLELFKEELKLILSKDVVGNPLYPTELWGIAGKSIPVTPNDFREETVFIKLTGNLETLTSVRIFQTWIPKSMFVSPPPNDVIEAFVKTRKETAMRRRTELESRKREKNNFFNIP